MSIKIHDPATDDLPVTVPDGWPELNVSQFQQDKSLGKEVDANRLKDLLTLAAQEVTERYDMEVLSLPLDDTQTLYFKFAVFELAFSKLIPSLPVNNQHDSNMIDPEGMTKRIGLLKRSAEHFMREIPGYKSKPSFGVRLIHEET